MHTACVFENVAVHGSFESAFKMMNALTKIKLYVQAVKWIGMYKKTL